MLVQRVRPNWTALAARSRTGSKVRATAVNLVEHAAATTPPLSPLPAFRVVAELPEVDEHARLVTNRLCIVARWDRDDLPRPYLDL